MKMPTNKELQKQIDDLKSELATLKSFVNGMYMMISEDEGYMPADPRNDRGKMNS